MALLTAMDKASQENLGEELFRFAEELFPVCRSITGDGIRHTLAAIACRIPIQTFEVPTGTSVFDWTVPKEWNIRDGYIKSSDGRVFADFKRSNLHIVNYSVPIRAKMSMSEIRPHLHSIPEKPDCIPYRTSYYKEDWGFCLSHKELTAMADGEYEVFIDSSLEDGHLTYGECFLPGRTPEEVLISCHICHPSLANDNLSGLAVATFLAKSLLGRDLHYSYRFLFIPGTIGAITWLARNRDVAKRIRHGLVMTCVGDRGGFHYKRSRRGNAEIDRAVQHVLRHNEEPFEILEFSPYGYDERQYCSPGFDLPVGCLMRSVWGTFPEYHTSADNLNFIHPSKLAASYRVCASVVNVLECNRRFRNLNPFCEPQLGRRNLYRTVGGPAAGADTNALLWVLNLSDGEHSLLDIAERSGHAFSMIKDAAELLLKSDLLSVVQDAG